MDEDVATSVESHTNPFAKYERDADDARANKTHDMQLNCLTFWSLERSRFYPAIGNGMPLYDVWVESSLFPVATLGAESRLSWVTQFLGPSFRRSLTGLVNAKLVIKGPFALGLVGDNETIQMWRDSAVASRSDLSSEEIEDMLRIPPAVESVLDFTFDAVETAAAHAQLLITEADGKTSPEDANDTTSPPSYLPPMDEEEAAYFAEVEDVASIIINAA